MWLAQDTVPPSSPWEATRALPLGASGTLLFFPHSPCGFITEPLELHGQCRMQVALKFCESLGQERSCFQTGLLSWRWPGLWRFCDHTGSYRLPRVRAVPDECSSVHCYLAKCMRVPREQASAGRSQLRDAAGLSGGAPCAQHSVPNSKSHIFQRFLFLVCSKAGLPGLLSMCGGSMSHCRLLSAH